MEGKLIKLGLSEGYRLDDLNGNYIASTLNGKNKLSLKNCETVANGYDLDEYQEGVFYAGQFGHPSPEGFSDEQVGRLHGFIDGFQKALEILGDKKFSEEQLKDSLLAFISEVSCEDGQLISKTPVEAYEWIENHVQSLQQTEWDVEIEMEQDYLKWKQSDIEDIKDCLVPKLDADGCLILRRI